MKQNNRIRLGIGLALAACCLAVFVVGAKQADEPAVDSVVYKEFMSAQVSDVYDLEQFFTAQQDEYLPITPPAADFVLHQSGSPNVLPFSWKDFPEFSKNLVPEYENSVPVYSVTILEDPLTRETVFLNAKGEKILTLAPPFDYDPFSYLRSIFPSLYAGRYSFDQISYWQSLYDPARIQISAKLIPTEYVEPYLYVSERIAEEAALAAAVDGGGFTLLRSGEADSNIVFEVMATTNGIRLVIGYPNDFTNRLDVFTCNDLLQYVWTFAKKELSTTGTNEITWVDTNYWVASGPPVRFYAAGNADLDTDHDGYSDASEIMVYRTSETDSNSRPVRVSGIVSYTGIETGTIYVLSTTASSSWSIAQSSALPGPGAYTNDVANDESYWFKAFRDANTSYSWDEWEPWGIYSNAALTVTTDVSGINITMQDQPSIWGTIDYTGSETGDIHVIAVTTSNSWSTTYECVIPYVQGEDPMTGGVVYVTFPAPFSIHGLPASNYWIRAFMDSDTNGAYTHLEVAGQYSSNAIPVSNRVTGINFAVGLDSDGDEMPDWWEWEHGFNPFNAADGQEDRDGDEAQNFKEYLFNINPDVQDSDGDGMPDSWEIRYGLIPSSADATNDLDADGLNNIDEYRRGTDPTDPDSDNDLISDGANALTGIYAGPDPNPLTAAPDNFPAFNITDTNKTRVAGEDPRGRPIVAWKAADALGKQQLYVMQWFGLASDTVGAWAGLEGKWEAFGNSALGSGVTAATNGVTKFDMAVDTNGWPAVCWVEKRTGTTNLYYLAWTGTNWAELHNSYSSGINSIYTDISMQFGHYETNSGGGVTNYLNYTVKCSFDDCALTFDTLNRPVATYIRYIAGSPAQASIQLKRDNGTNWAAMGNSTTTAGISGQGDYFCPRIAVGPDNRPVVSYFQWTGSPIGYLYSRKWNPDTSAWDVYGGSPVDGTQYSTEVYNMAVNRSNEVLIAFQRAAYARVGSPYQYGLWLRKSSGSGWAGYGGSDVGIGIAKTNSGYIQTAAASIFIQNDNQAGVSWLQYGGIVYNWLMAREGTNWNEMGYSFTDYGVNESGQRVGWLGATPGNSQPVVAYSEQTGTGSSDPYKLVVKQYQADTDGDGLSDNFELLHGLNNTTNDTDSDGLTDLDEWTFLGTSATTNDTDGDGLLDGQELLGTAFGFPSNPLLTDSDGDGILDGDDVFLNSLDSDQDGDGIPDYLDTDDDNDGLLDVDETTTDPLNPDSDGDGIPDGLEGVPDSTAPVIYIIEPEEGATL